MRRAYLVQSILYLLGAWHLALTSRKVEIADLEKKLKQEEEDITELRNRIAQLRSVWLPKVENMVSAIDKNFSKFFKRINCTGEVRLKTDPNDDFDKFGIEICVSYRANQPVQPLNVHVQSGGERSVATMLYLISLQTISDSPFRLVDEINQVRYQYVLLVTER